MPTTVRLLSGSLIGREIRVEKDSFRIGDAPDADVRLDPNEPDYGGARGRVVEVSREAGGFRLRSTGDRDLSGPGEAPPNRWTAPGEEIRFGAWGPVFVLGPSGETLTAVLDGPKTAPIPVVGDDSTARRRRDAAGEKPVGEKTVYMMIQDALSKAKQAPESGVLERGTVFFREIVTDTIQSATRSLKIGLALTVAAVVILAAALAYNIRETRRSVEEAGKVAGDRVAGVKKELGGEIDKLRKERDSLAAEADSVSRKIAEVEKTAGAGQAAVESLRGKLKEAEDRRRELEARLQRAVVALEGDRAALARQLEQLEKERAADRERQRVEMERLRQETAARPAEAPVPPAPTAPPPAPVPVVPR